MIIATHQCDTCFVVEKTTPLNLSTNVFADIPLWYASITYLAIKLFVQPAFFSTPIKICVGETFSCGCVGIALFNTASTKHIINNTLNFILFRFVDSIVLCNPGKVCQLQIFRNGMIMIALLINSRYYNIFIQRYLTDRQ